MAPFDAGLPTVGARFGRIAFGSICGLVSAMEAGGGREHLLVAGFFAAMALFLLRPALGRIRQGVDFALDFSVVGALAFLCDPSGVLWRAPDSLRDLFTLTPIGASSAVGLYLLGVAILPGSPFRAARGAVPAAASCSVSWSRSARGRSAIWAGSSFWASTFRRRRASSRPGLWSCFC